ncbi:MAG: pectate lyase [Bacteroidia bacterium]
MKSLFLTSLIAFLSFFSLQAQEDGSGDSYLNKSWREVATAMPPEWYGSDEAKRVAENVLLTQKEVGGWEKNKPYHHIFSEEEKADFVKNMAQTGATFDNGATTTELRFLVKVYTNINDERYKQAFERGLNYIFAAQYANGGWPQFFPFREGVSVDYSAYITYNDNAMVDVMQLLKEIYSDEEAYAAFQLDSEVKEKAQKAFEKGIECILKTQIIANGKQTVWCAQHDPVSLAPAKARSYELESFSGGESVGIVDLLMDIDHPSDDVVAAINGAIKWFEAHKIEGIKLEKVTDKKGKENLVVVEDKAATPVWARFYDLETGKPFFCDRDGIKKSSLAEIGYERRNGYAWYTEKPAALLKKYPDWEKKRNEE